LYLRNLRSKSSSNVKSNTDQNLRIFIATRLHIYEKKTIWKSLQYRLSHLKNVNHLSHLRLTFMITLDSKYAIKASETSVSETSASENNWKAINHLIFKPYNLPLYFHNSDISLSLTTLNIVYQCEQF